MSINQTDLARIAELSKLRLSDDESGAFQDKLNNVLKMVDCLTELDATDIEPLTHPLEQTQRLRADVVTETNQRELLQSIAPNVKAGLYLVPQVVDTEN